MRSADYNISIRLDRESAISDFGRGLAKLRKGNVKGGNADIAAARATQADSAETFGH